ncbi:helix-turn-helix domain-containing protein [Pseudoteredinibacter isoporae]|uniref:helix-turn-helix domain-containing protein n=1 Tax=Pseudoteredinibacter isoporae TaxID=570281 RepID=UPI003107054F
MILKEIRLSRHLTQEQLAEISGLSARTIQRIESGQQASLESQKCLAAALDLSIDDLQQETFDMNRQSEQWAQLPLFLKIWFMFHFLQARPRRDTALRIPCLAHIAGFLFCLLGFWHEAALAGGLIMLATAYLFQLLRWQGDRYGIWYEAPE